ncbi:hypothetical protein STEG23_028905, partial [Scotinomys teguina]
RKKTGNKKASCPWIDSWCHLKERCCRSLEHGESSWQMHCIASALVGFQPGIK